LNIFGTYEPQYPAFGAGSETDSSSALFSQVYEDDMLQEGSPLDGRDSFLFQPQMSESGSLSTGDSGSPGSSSSYSATAASPVSSGADSYESPTIQQIDEMVPDSAVGFAVPPSVVMSTASPAATVSAPERKKRRQSSKAGTQKAVGKKRKSGSDEGFVMDMEKLSRMTSVELDGLLADLSASGRLKSEDEKKLKALRRQAKNRESAQISRNRHRDHLAYIEAKLEHEQLVNKRLRDYVDELKGSLMKSNLPVPPEPEMPEFKSPLPSELSLVEPSRTIVRPLRTAGICLMMFVLSIGIVMNAMSHASPSSSVTTTADADNKNSLVPVPAHPSEPSPRVIVDSSSAPLSQSSEPAPPPDTVNVIRESAYLSYDTEKDDSSTLALVIPDTKEQQVTADAMVPRSSCLVMPYATKVIFGDAKPRLADDSWTLGNTSYILVNDPTEFVPRSVDLDHVQARTEPVIGLLVPASSFNIPNLAPDDVVELVCGVHNATLIPRNVLARSLK